MSQGETLIVILLAVIAYFLYIISKQLSILTGKKIKFGFRLPRFSNPVRYKMKKSEDEPSNLPN